MSVRLGADVRVWLRAAVVLIAPAARAGAQDVEGAKDHPMVSRFPNYFISEYDATDFGNFDVETGADAIKVEGRYWRITYELEEGRKKGGPLEISNEGEIVKAVGLPGTTD